MPTPFMWECVYWFFKANTFVPGYPLSYDKKSKQLKMTPHRNRWLLINGLDTGTQLTLYIYVFMVTMDDHQNIFNEMQEIFQNFFLIFVLGGAILVGATLYTIVICGQQFIAHFNLWSQLAPGLHK